jgi:DNA-binding GntR family transcriptional regulator
VVTSDAAPRTVPDALLVTLQSNAVRRTAEVPLHVQAANAIEQALRKHNPPTDQPLPPERDLASALHVSRPTLRQALSSLAESGWIYTRRGIGTFAAPRVMERPLGLSSLYQDLKDRGLQPETHVLRLDTVAADASVAQDLRTAVGTMLLSMERLRLTGGQPVALMETVLDLQGSPPFTKDDLTADGLYNLLRIRCGIEVAMGAQWVSARLASGRELGLLQLRSPAAVLVTRRVTFDTAGRGVEISTITFPGGTRFVERRL